MRCFVKLACIGLFLLGSAGLGASPAAAEWRAAMERIMGPFPGPDRRGPVELRIEETVSGPGFVRQKVSYQSEPGARVPAYLLLPDAAVTNRSRSFPAVLALHQTHPAGQKVVVGLGRSPDDEYGVELVQRGYVVLAPPYPHLADYAPSLAPFASGTMKAIWDNSRGLDLLASLPCVATNRGFGAIGHSLGGHNSLFTAAFDTRISAVATSCGFDSFRDYYDGKDEVWQPGRGWCQDRYMPRLAAYRGRLAELPFDFPQVLAAIAPRPVLVNAPTGDSNFRWRSVDRVVAEAGELARSAGVTAAITVEHPEVPHRFPPEQREHAYRLFDATLKSPGK
jgi:hypothetical protein